MSHFNIPCHACKGNGKERVFPIQGGSPIPWAVAERAYEAYSKQYGSGQTLERLAERGGFGVGEMDRLYPQWRDEISIIVQQQKRIAELEKQLEQLTTPPSRDVESGEPEASVKCPKCGFTTQPNILGECLYCGGCY